MIANYCCMRALWIIIEGLFSEIRNPGQKKGASEICWKTIFSRDRQCNYIVISEFPHKSIPPVSYIL